MKLPRFLDPVLQRSATRFLRRVHRITHRMPVRLRGIQRRRVVVVAPHADDESIAVGGTLALYRRAGAEVTALFVTSDPPDADGTSPRKREAAAAEVLGHDVRFLGFTDGQASLQEEGIAAALAEAIRELRPEIVLCPFPGDQHRDHQAVSASTAGAISRSGFSGEIWCYETWGTLWPNVAIDISDVVDEKRRAIACYQTQLAHRLYVEATLGLNRFRGLKVGVTHAEGLFACSAPQFVELSLALGVV